MKTPGLPSEASLLGHSKLGIRLPAEHPEVLIALCTSRGLNFANNHHGNGNVGQLFKGIGCCAQADSLPILHGPSGHIWVQIVVL